MSEHTLLHLKMTLRVRYAFEFHIILGFCFPCNWDFSLPLTLMINFLAIMTSQERLQQCSQEIIIFITVALQIEASWCSMLYKHKVKDKLCPREITIWMLGLWRLWVPRQTYTDSVLGASAYQQNQPVLGASTGRAKPSPPSYGPDFVKLIHKKRFHIQGVVLLMSVKLLRVRYYSRWIRRPESVLCCQQQE